jgi:chromosome segregation ATPase
MSSLYDKFHSDENINYLYNLLNKLVVKQTGNSIINDMKYFNYYNNKLREIFIQTRLTKIPDINKEVLRGVLKYILEDIDKSKQNIKRSKMNITDFQDKKDNLNQNNFTKNNISSPKTPKILNNNEIKVTENEESEKENIMNLYNNYIQRREEIPNGSKETQVKVKPLTKDPTNLETPITNLETPITNLETPITNLETPITNLETPITNLETPITNLETPITKKI